MVVLMLVSSQDQFKTAFDTANQRLFGVAGAYDKTIADAAANDAFTGLLEPLAMGDDIMATLGAAVVMPSFMLDPVPELGLDPLRRGARSGDFRKALRGMLGGIWVTAGLSTVFVLLAAKTFGWLFYNATNVNFINWFYGYTTTDPTVPIWSYPPLIASYLVDNTIFRVAMIVIFGAWFPGLVGDVVLVVDPDDLRGGVRPDPP